MLKPLLASQFIALTTVLYRKIKVSKKMGLVYQTASPAQAPLQQPMERRLWYSALLSHQFIKRYAFFIDLGLAQHKIGDIVLDHNAFHLS